MVDLPTSEFHRQVLWTGGTGTTEIALNSTSVKEFLSKDNTFDLVISELFYQEAMFMLAYKYKAPLVLVTTYGNSMKNNILLRNPLQLATIISEFMRIDSPTSFLGRLHNAYFCIYEYIFWKYWYLPMQDALVDKYFKDLPRPLPSLEELHKNASLVLMNTHFSYDPPAAYLPNIVEVGGLHLKETDTKLPEDLQKILDEAKYGVVYVNFGSNVKSSELPAEKKDAFINVFKKLKQIVLWKWEEPLLENKPENVIIRAWMPQKEILAHPNIKVFIAHGGLIGMQEATFYGVPIVGIPVYCDQYNNLLLAEQNGYGKILDYHDINEHSLERILNEVLKDDSFRRRAREMSLRFRDRPMSALDTAVFWIEYVIRHKGADFMKNPALKLNWFAFQMLDVYVFVLVVVAIFTIVTVKLLLAIVRKGGGRIDSPTTGVQRGPMAIIRQIFERAALFGRRGRQLCASSAACRLMNSKCAVRYGLVPPREPSSASFFPAEQNSTSEMYEEKVCAIPITRLQQYFVRFIKSAQLKLGERRAAAGTTFAAEMKICRVFAATCSL
ncbi:UDP-glucuronosyltransferase 2B31 [Eumeta japonica]|uniref:UDP-glucuronosyltransferase 2B31 n=1 Tax=Eumeta variegata TaxID=151549 RepID=A0A4C1XLG2_EUMVA|nr:UDP-glucuronosyltransferase 2B31 [Eumeta japonica]